MQTRHSGEAANADDRDTGTVEQVRCTSYANEDHCINAGSAPLSASQDTSWWSTLKRASLPSSFRSLLGKARSAVWPMLKVLGVAFAALVFWLRCIATADQVNACTILSMLQTRCGSERHDMILMTA